MAERMVTHYEDLCVGMCDWPLASHKTGCIVIRDDVKRKVVWEDGKYIMREYDEKEDVLAGQS